MIIKLKNNTTLLLDKEYDFSDDGYFVLDSVYCDNPDLSVFPASYRSCISDADRYSILRGEIILGTRSDIID